MHELNLVDEVWKESRPKPPNKPIRIHDLKYAGLDVASKLSFLRAEFREAGASAIVISMLDEVAWLLNLVNTFSFEKLRQYNWKLIDICCLFVLLSSI